MSDVTTRRATAADIESVASLFDQYRQFYEQAPDADGAAAFIKARVTSNQSVVLVAVSDGEDVGFTQLYPSFSSVSMAPIWILNDLFVTSQYRRKGVGRALMEAAQAFARNDGAKRLCLATAQDNVSAQALYESQGWQRDGFLHYEFEVVESR